MGVNRVSTDHLEPDTAKFSNTMGGGGSKETKVAPAAATPAAATPADAAAAAGPKAGTAQEPLDTDDLEGTGGGQASPSGGKHGVADGKDHHSSHVWDHPDVPKPYDPEECDECATTTTSYCLACFLCEKCAHSFACEDDEEWEEAEVQCECCCMDTPDGFCTDECNCGCECHHAFAEQEMERIQDEVLKQLGIQALPSKSLRKILNLAQNANARFVNHLFADCSPAMMIEEEHEAEIIEKAIMNRRQSMAEISAEDEAKRAAAAAAAHEKWVKARKKFTGLGMFRLLRKDVLIAHGEAAKLEEEKAKKPVYDDSHHKAATRVQSVIRGKIGRREAKEAMKALEKKLKASMHHVVGALDRCLKRAQKHNGMFKDSVNYYKRLEKEAELLKKTKEAANIKVAARFRPLNGREKNLRAENPDIKPLPLAFRNAEIREGQDATDEEKKRYDTVKLGFKAKEKEYTFDFMFDGTTMQSYFYERACEPQVTKYLDGINTTFFAYGQTGAGKSWSMFGSMEKQELTGLVPRAAGQIFEYVVKMQTSGECDSSTTCSYIEIYNEKCNDLLNTANKDMKIREMKGQDAYLEGVTWRNVSTFPEIEQLIEDGMSTRAVAATKMNAVSSRSHCIVTIKLDQKGASIERTSRINLVDLAGSEKVGKTGASGQTLKEAQNINKSLTCLGQCIKKLTAKPQKGKKVHVPFRDSKLTRLLQNSLGGNARTLLIVAASPHEDNLDETFGTLDFAKRAREIKCTAKVNKKKNKQAMIPPKVPCEVLEKDLEDSMKVTNDIKALIAEVKQLYKDKKWKVKMSQEYVKKEEDFMDALDHEETVIEEHTGKSTRMHAKQVKGKVKVRKKRGKA